MYCDTYSSSTLDYTASHLPPFTLFVEYFVSRLYSLNVDPMIHCYAFKIQPATSVLLFHGIYLISFRNLSSGQPKSRLYNLSRHV